MRRLVPALVLALCACAHVPPSPTAVLDEGILEWKKRDYPTTSDPSMADAGAAPPVRLPLVRSPKP